MTLFSLLYYHYLLVQLKRLAATRRNASASGNIWLQSINRSLVHWQYLIGIPPIIGVNPSPEQVFLDIFLTQPFQVYIPTRIWYKQSISSLTAIRALQEMPIFIMYKKSGPLALVLCFIKNRETGFILRFSCHKTAVSALSCWTVLLERIPVFHLKLNAGVDMLCLHPDSMS